MPVLRNLSVIYLLAAASFVVAIGLAEHPVTAEKITAALNASNHSVLEPGWALVVAESRMAYRSMTAQDETPSARVAHAESKPAPKSEKPARVARVEPKLKPSIVPRSAPEAKVTIDIAPAKRTVRPKMPPLPMPSAAELARVQQRLKDSLTSSLYAHFDLFLYISKAQKLPVGQRMYVFAKNGGGGLDLRHTWPVSTGREKVEYNKLGWRLPSYTPNGYYELDPRRMYRHYRSIQWDQPMPYAMFFNWIHEGDKTGLAIHAAHGKDISELGSRASAGCIRLAPEHARALFDLIRADYKGPVPRFAYDHKTHTMSNDGLLMRDAKGNLRFTKGYKVLVVIEDFDGSNVVAALM